MDVSAEGNRIAYDVLLISLIQRFDLIAPGQVSRMFDEAAKQLSERLEKEPNDAIKDALYVVGRLAESLVKPGHPFDYVYNNLQEVNGDSLADSLRLSCLLDALEPLAPGIADRVEKDAIQGLEKLAAENDWPFTRRAVERARKQHYLSHGDDFATAERKAREA